MSMSRRLAWMALFFACAGCKTRLWELPDAEPPVDLSQDTRDLAVLPDLAPPPDLVLPYVCRHVYVVDEDGRFSAFDTDKRAFEDLGKLACPATGGATPFSMSVARDGNAYVLYNDGELFRVDTQTVA